ncbi:MAG: uroporphyrinogen-III C-methyltransferase [Azoarcus sp.]|jgi:uroporphyrin-3 C-methyltransferase|nr:uroporphyrinogen-III C-methyltransferase [Azoarcus sp.]
MNTSASSSDDASLAAASGPLAASEPVAPESAPAPASAATAPAPAAKAPAVKAPAAKASAAKASAAKASAAKVPAPVAAPPEARPAAPAPRGWAAGWALLLALLALAGAAYSVWQAHAWRAQTGDVGKELAGKLEESATAATEVRALMRQEHESLASLQGKLGAVEDKLERGEGQAAALESLYQQFSRSQEYQLVAEVEHAVTIADQQLRYAGSVDTALIALRGARSRLDESAYRQLEDLRRSLAAAIDKLATQDTLDIPGTSLRLEQLLAKVDGLPLLYSGEMHPNEEAPTAAAAPQGTGAAAFARELAYEVWTELRSLVKVERLDTTADPVLLAPEQSTFLRENLKIRLLTARLALLARDGHTYATDLGQARNWIERFFDTKNDRVQTVIDDLRALEVLSVGVKRYDELNDVFAALRRVQARNLPGAETIPGATPEAAASAPAQPQP